MSAKGYDGAGAGGKFRKTPFRRGQTTPYDRPPTALRPSQAAAQNNGWFSKLVDPASKLITYGAHKLFSSVFRKRLLPPPQPPKGELDENTETKDVKPQSTSTVFHCNTEELATAGNNDASKVSGVAELEAMLKQKTFTRSEIDHLTTLLLSRTEDNSVGVQKGGSRPKTSDLQAGYDDTQEKLAMPSSQANGIEHAVAAAISTPAIGTKVLEEDAASPAELAKAYMGNRSVKALPPGLSFQNQMPGEEYSTPYKPPLNLKSPVASLQKPGRDIGTSGNGFLTPRFRGRSAIYSMARTPYSSMHKSTGLKASETAVRLPLSINENKQFNESQKQPLKRRSSVLDNDIGSVGPIRRIRQKPNLLHPKTLTLPASGGPRATYGSGPLLDGPELPPSSGLSSHSHSLLKSVADNSKPSTRSGYVPSQSIETAQKIFQQLDKFTAKGKSLDLKTETGGGNSSSSITPGGSSHHRIGTLKIFNNIDDNKKENGAMDFVDAYTPLSKTPKTVEEAGPKKPVITSDNLISQNRAEDKVPASYSSHDSKITSHPGFDHPQRKQAFQMSAHEDYLELDDDVHLNVMSTPLGESIGNTELSKKSSAIPDSIPAKEAISEKTFMPEPKSSDSLLSKEQAESLVDGPVTAKTIGFTFPVAPTTSSSNSMGSAAVAASKPADHEEFATLSKQTSTAPSFSVKSDHLSPFPFSTSSSATGMAVQDTKLEVANSTDTTVAKANRPEETDKKSTQEPVDGLKKPQDASSPAVSSAKGIFNFGLPANNATPGALSSPVPTSVAPSLGLFSSVSANQSAVPVNSDSSPPLFSSSSGLSNGFAASTSVSSTATAGTMVGSATSSSIPAFLGSTSQVSNSATTASLSSGPSFQFGSTTSVTFGTSASLVAENLGSKSVEATSGNTPNSNVGSGGTVIAELSASSKAAANNEAQPAAPTGTGSLFGFQATSAASPISTSTPAFPTQSISFGLSGSTSFSSGASSFGSVSPAVGPINAASSSSGVSSMSSSISSSSGTTPSLFGSSWQPSKSTFPASTFGATSPSTGFSFGAAASVSSSDGNKSSILFGSSTSNSSLSCSAPFVFGSAPPSSSSSSSASSTPFIFGTSTPSSASSSSTSSSPFVFGSSSSSLAAPVFSFSSSISTTTSSAPSPSLPQPVFGATTPAFGFGSTSTPSGNNDQMTMEDSMAEDSMQAPTGTGTGTGTSIFGQSPIAAPSGGFVFGAAPSPSPPPSAGFIGTPSSGNPFQFGSQPNQMPPQNPSPFQPSNSAEFHAGGTGSFSLGSGGGDKSNRRIVKVKSKMRRK